MPKQSANGTPEESQNLQILQATPQPEAPEPSLPSGYYYQTEEEMNAATLINQTSGNVEIYTPPEIIEAARECMGGIDLDPASCAKANETVKAARYFAAPIYHESNIGNLPYRYYHGNGGLDQQWKGRVWLNMPFSKSEAPCNGDCKNRTCQNRGFHMGTRHFGNKAWVEKAVFEWNANVDQLCMICFASTSEAWFRPLLAFPQCFLAPRTNYRLPDGSVYRGVTKGSVVTYMGPDVQAFKKAFSKLGVVKVAL